MALGSQSAKKSDKHITLSPVANRLHWKRKRKRKGRRVIDFDRPVAEYGPEARMSDAKMLINIWIQMRKTGEGFWKLHACAPASDTYELSFCLFCFCFWWSHLLSVQPLQSVPDDHGRRTSRHRTSHLIALLSAFLQATLKHFGFPTEADISKPLNS